MTAQEKKRLAYWLGLLVLLLPALSMVDSRYVKASDFRTDVVRDSAWKAEVRRDVNYIACRVDRPIKDCPR